MTERRLMNGTPVWAMNSKGFGGHEGGRRMDDATGEAEGTGLLIAFDRRLKLEIHGATVTSDVGLVAFRELADALDLTAFAADLLRQPAHREERAPQAARPVPPSRVRSPRRVRRRERCRPARARSGDAVDRWRTRKEGKQAIKWTRLSCTTFRANAVRLQLHALADNLANFLRILALPGEIERGR